MVRVRFFTLGCKVNQYETQALACRFAAEGFQVEQEGEDSDVLIINSCTVTAEGDRKNRQLLRRLRREHPQAVIALTGCYPQAFPQEMEALTEADVITGSRDRAGLVAAVRRFLGERKRIVAITPHAPGETFEAMHTDDFGRRTRAFVKIEDGCENYCAYCIIPTARGPIRSKPLEDLKAELEELAASGYKEVVLAGINLSSYGRDLGYRLIDAIQLACRVPGLERIRLGSLEPDLITPEDFRLMSLEPKLCPQFHLSLQSGCDTVLERMGRHYNTAQYLEVCRTIHQRFPLADLTTDLMVGFPGETDEEFQQSLDFAAQVGFSKIHAFSYSPRPGTRAAAMPDQVPGQVKKARSAALIAQGDALRKKFLQNMVGLTQPVLFEDRGKDGLQIGYTPNYTPVIVAEPEDLHGQILPVLLTGLEGDGCTGVLTL